jgi:hypothetical protein
MNVLSQKKIVLLGMMSRMPVAGVVWQTVHYLVGLQRLGYDVYYVEAHGLRPSPLMEKGEIDGSTKAVAFIAGALRRFDLGDRWAYHALHADGHCYGKTRAELERLYDSAALIINLHGGTLPLPEHTAGDRLVYIGTDPVELEIELHENRIQTVDFLAAHRALFTFAENHGRPDCALPVSERFHFRPTRQPVVADFWHSPATAPGPVFTTIGNWRQLHRDVRFRGEVYHWSKHHEFLKFVYLPRRTRQPFELALGCYDENDTRLLEALGWRVRPAAGFSSDVDAYRNYILRSRGEFTVAKDQNVRLRTGWFSDRGATYLAAGRPVITQETGFSNILPTGAGLFGFSTLEEALRAVDAINGNYARHSQAAAALARDYFGYEVVLKKLLDELGL